ncbi:MAG: hypothetical protein ACK5Y8_17600 [Betaproteobacteria bacterium]|nr:hypothetical protein [Rubrivivax sp.]
MAAEPVIDVAEALSRASALRPVALQLRVLEPLHVLTVRHLPGADAAWLRALAMPQLPQPGCWVGDDTLQLLWRSASEVTLVTQQTPRLAALQAALRPGADPLAYAVDRSPGTLGIELAGPALEALLARLMDASAVPAKVGRATRARCADIAVVLLRLAPQQLQLLVDRPLAGHLGAWLLRAAMASLTE